MSRIRRVCPTCGAAYGPGPLFCPKDGSPLGGNRQEAGRDPYLGMTLDGRLQLDRLVGLGSMGRVYRARQLGLERNVAVKILHASCCKDATLVARFQREGRVAASLDHPNVVALLDAGHLPRNGTASDGEPFLVMEYLDGLSLRSALVAAAAPLGLARAVHVLLQVSDAMALAHEQGIVHRDLKPENVMLVRCGSDPDFVKVLDFGVARVGEGDTSIATHAGAVLGTATYACPESARGDRVGPPGDVYALATLLFEALAGEPPFAGESPVDVLIQHAQAQPPDVRTVARAASTPAPIASLIAQNLAKHPADRAQDARTFGRGLASAALEAGLHADRLAGGATLLGYAGAGAERGGDATTVDRQTPAHEGSPEPRQGGTLAT